MQQVSLQEQINELETKIAFQDDLIEQLNQLVITLFQQHEIHQKQIQLLSDKLQSQGSSPLASESEETPPPHY